MRGRGDGAALFYARTREGAALGAGEWRGRFFCVGEAGRFLQWQGSMACEEGNPDGASAPCALVG